MCLQFDLEIINEKGLHARASAKFVELCELYQAEVDVSFGEYTVAGDSIIGLLTLAATQGSVISIMISGRDKEVLKTALTELVQAGFHEET